MKIAILQHAPVFFDMQRSLAKLADLLGDAASQGAELAVAGETWLTGYPAFLDHVPKVAVWDYAPMRDVYAMMHANALDIQSEAYTELESIVRKSNISLLLGCNEAVGAGYGNGSLFNSFILLNQQGERLLHHRKLMPTYTEKMLYALGDGAGLVTARLNNANIGGLICWEHWMPLTRQVLHHAGEHIHFALWPTVHDMHQVASRHYAFEGRCYVVAVGQIQRVADWPAQLPLPDALSQKPAKPILNGGSCVVGPDGSYILQPCIGDEKTLIVELDTTALAGHRMTLDVSGHYSRPDIFTLSVNKNRPN